MKKFLIIIGIVIIIIIVAFIGAWIWVDGLKEDKANTKVKMDEILEAYPKFNKEVDNFSLLRNQLYEYKKNLFLETLRDNTDDWNSFMDNYLKAINKVEDSALILKENCKIKYGDVNVSSKCTTFKANYEAANNYYINDIVIYNDMVKEYEEYNADHGNKYSKLNRALFGTYNDYIDYDEDGEFFGKGEDVDEG